MSDKLRVSPSDEYDRSIPLKAVKMVPPAPNAIYGQNEYTVHIELSRNASKFEREVVKKYFPHGRIYSNTLELSQTTVENIAENAAEVSGGLGRIEREGRAAEDAALEVQRQQDAEAAAEAARHRNLTHIAEQVRFQ